MLSLCYISDNVRFLQELQQVVPNLSTDHQIIPWQQKMPQPLVVFVDYPADSETLNKIHSLNDSHRCLKVLLLPEYSSITSLESDSYKIFNDIIPRTVDHRFLAHKIYFYCHSLNACIADGACGDVHNLNQTICSLKNRLFQVDNDLQTRELVIDKINYISNLSRKINCLDLEKIAAVCINKVPGLINARFASLFTYNQQQQTLQLIHHNHPYKISRVINLNQSPESLMSLAIRDKKLMLIRNLEELKKDVSMRLTYSRNYLSNSCIIAPLLQGERVLGILNLADKIDAPCFDDKADLPPVTLLCEIIGSAMANIELYEQVERKAQTDSMTNLLNHQTFYQTLDREVRRARRYSSPLSLIMIDLDCLKKINDQYGHRAGDAVLMHVTNKITRCIRNNIDSAARYGGDEFAVILPNTTLTDASIVAGRLVEMVDTEIVKVDELSLHATVSVGLAQYSSNLTIEQFMNETDSALFNAKAGGKNRIVIAQ